MKKSLTLLLAVALMLSLCGTALAYDAANPITIEFWHTRGSGANLDSLTRSVNTFNETIGKEQGIIVEPIYQGSYGDNVNKMSLAMQSGDQPVVGVTSSAHTAILLDENIAADMAPYMAETGFDMGVFFDCFLDVPAIHDGQIRTLPYVRSTPVFYYNKTMADKLGLKAPETMAEMEAFCKALTVYDASGNVEVYGLELLSDPSFQEGAFLWSTGSPWLNEDGTRSPALDDGSLLTLLSDWRRFVDEGWCRPFDSTSASSTCQQLFYQGKIAAFNASCGSLSNIDKYTKEAGYELGVCYLPAYNLETRNTGIGGGNLILLEGSTDEEKRAGWAFIQFLVSPEQVALEAISSGYLPTHKDMTSNKTMMDFWAANPLFKVAYEQLAWGHGNETPYFPARQEYMTNVGAVISMLIQEGSLTAQEAFDQIKADNAYLFQ